jgi:RNA polymerase sigma-70 factor (ECF subfamily)
MTVREIHDRYVDFVWANLHRMGVRSADVPDLLQEVFVVVHRRLHTFDGSSKMSTWLFGICTRVAASHRRRAHVRREQPVAAIREDVHHDTPESAAIARDQAAVLQSLLDTLDVDKRAVLVMFEIEELSCAEIGAQLGIPTGTVYSRLHHAREALKRAWERSARAEERRGAA